MALPRILIAADEPVARDLHRQLAKMGYEPLAPVRLVEEAVSLAEQLRPELVLMAVHLRGERDGLAAAQLIHDRLDLPVVLLPGTAGEETLDRARKSASFGFLPEPFTERDLRGAVETALYRHRAETVLRQSQEEQAAILRTTSDGFWLVDTQGRILEVNEAGCRMLGYARDEFLGKSIIDFEADETASEIAAHIERIKQTGSAQLERRHRCKDGHLIDVAMTISYLPGGGGRFSVFSRDVTDLKRDQALLGGQNQVLEMIATGAALAATLDKLLRVIESQSPEMLSSILLLDADGVHLRHGAAPSLPREYLEAIDGGAIGPSAGSCGTAAFRRQSVIVEDIATDPLWADYRELALPHGLRACWSTPIFAAPGKVMGTFAMYYRQPGRPTANHERLIGIATQVAAIAIGHERTAEALRHSETKFRTLYESGPDSVLLLDEHRILDCNRVALEAFGCASSAELCSKHPADLSPVLQPCGTDSLTLSQRRIAAAMAIGHQRFEWVHKRTDTGASFPAEVVLNAMELDGKRILQAVVRDITERRRAEDKARALTQRLTLATDAAAIGVWDWDLEADRWYATPNYYAMTGDEPVEGFTFRQRWIHRLHPEDLAVVTEKVRRALAGIDETYQYEARVLHADGTYHWVSVTGRVAEVNAEGKATRMLGVRMDITERKRTEVALRASEERYRDLIDNSVELISTCDLDGNFLSVNETTIRTTGYSREILLQKNLTDLLVPETRHLFPEYSRTVRVAGEARGIMRIRTASGETRFWEYHATLRTEGVAAPVVRGMALDITDRLRAERALRASHERFELANRATFNVIWDWDLTTRVIWRNDRFQELFGYARDEVGASFDAAVDLIPPVDLERVKASLQVALDAKSEFWTDQYSFRRKDGSFAAVEDRAVITRDADGRAIRMLGAMQDISERQRAEEALRQSEERHRLLADNASDVIWTMGLDGGFTYVSPSVEKLLGYTAGEVMLKTVDEVLRPESAAAMGAQLAPALAALRSGLPFREFRLELEQTRKDGTTVWTEVSTAGMLDAAGKPLGILGIVRDITERKKAEAGLRLQSGALEAAANSIVITDRQGLIEWANPAFALATGYGTNEAVGKRPGDLLKSGRQAREFYATLWDTILAGGVWHGELINRRKDGSLFTEEMTITPLKDESGAVTHFVAVKQDVSERKALEQKFLQAQKLEAVGRLAGGIAHDFNNMLGVILGYTDVALRQVDPALALHADLLEIQGAALRSATLTRQLLAFARRETITPKLVNLNETVAGMLAMLRRLIGEDIRVAWQPAATLWSILMDPAQIDQILANLCVNSRDAIADVGVITIATANCAIDAGFCAEHADAVPGEYVRLSVSDTGGGMDKETLSQIFEPFFTTKGVGEGTGLGLPMVYGAVRQNGGFLTVASAPGQGAVFEIYLPRDLGLAERAGKTDKLAALVRGRETILLVEDEPALLKLTTRVLEGKGYSVIAASNPGEAIHRARAPGAEIHLLLTDVVMPEMNGREVAKTLLTLYPRLKCLFMSGYTADVIARGGVLAEGVDFLQKPFSPPELAAKVREVLDRE